MKWASKILDHDITSKLISFFTSSFIAAGMIWGATEAISFFQGNEFKIFLGRFWWGIYIVIPIIFGLVVSLRTPKKKKSGIDLVVEAGTAEFNVDERSYISAGKDVPYVEIPIAFWGRARNDGRYAIKLIGYGVHATNEKGIGASLAQEPMGEPDPDLLEPGENHEFAVDMWQIVILLKSSLKWRGKVTICAYYEAYDQTRYESDWKHTFDLDDMEGRSRGNR